MKNHRLSLSTQHLRSIILAAAFLFTAILNSKAQTPVPRPFTFCLETNDTIQMVDLAKCIELKAADPKLKVKGFTMSVKYGSQFVDYDPIKGYMIPPDILDEIIKHKHTMNYIDIKEIVTVEGKTQKKVKGYKIYVRR